MNKYNVTFSRSYEVFVENESEAEKSARYSFGYDFEFMDETKDYFSAKVSKLNNIDYEEAK